MPLSKVSYPYPNTLLIPSLLTESNTNSGISTSPYLEARNIIGSTIANGESQVKSISPDGNYDLRLWMRNDAGGFYYFNATGGSANVLRIAHSSTPRLVTQLTQDFTAGISANYGGRVNIDPSSASVVGLVTRGAVGQVSDLEQWQNSAGTVLSSITSSGTLLLPAATTGFASLRAPHGTAPSTPTDGDIWTTTGGIFVRVNGSTVGPLASSAGTLTNPMTTLGDMIYGGASGVGTRLIGSTSATRSFLGQTGDGTNSAAPTWTSSTGTGNVVLTSSPTITTPTIDVINAASATGTTQTLFGNTTSGTINIGGASFTTGIINIGTSGTSTNTINLGNINSTVFVSGNLTVNGTTTTINSSTLTVDDKNIEMGAVASGVVSTTGTVGSITGTGPWTATITGMTDTADLIVGSAMTATNGTGSLGAGGTYIVASVVSGTSVTYTATGGTTPVAGTVTNITTTGATDATANGGGIILKGATDKSILWDSTNANFTSTEHFNLASTKVFKINNTQVLSNTAVLGLTPTINATGYTLSGGTTAVAVTFAGGAAYTLSGTNGQTYTFPTTGGTLITASSPTITTPVIDTINVSGAAVAAALWNTTITSGSISIGGSISGGSINIANGAVTGNKTIGIGTSATGGTTAITLGSSSGATSTIQLNGAVTTNSSISTGGNVTTAGQLNLNYASPTIASNNASVASIFTATVTGVTIGSSTIRTTVYPADGTTSTGTASSGYMGMPQVSTAATRQFAATDAGKHIYVTATGQTLTIPAEGTVNFPVGTTIVVVNGSGVSTTITITTDTLRLANSALTGARTLASNGMCTLLKIATGPGIWIASGNGLT